MTTLFRRMAGAARLDVATYEEVEADRGATGQAVLIAVISSLAITLGDWHAGDGWFIPFVGGLVGWIVWIFFVWVVGVKLLPEPQTRSDLGELIRTTGFGSTPGLFRIFGLIPLVGWIVVILAWLWTLAALAVAVRQALDYRGTGRALIVCVAGFLAQLLVIRMIQVLLIAATT